MCRLRQSEDSQEEARLVANYISTEMVIYTRLMGSITGVQPMSEQYCTTKGLGWAFLVCVIFILGVPVGMWLALEGLSWYEKFS